MFIPTLIPFAIAVDWGRWFNLSYTMLIFFYFFCLKNKIFNLNENNKMLYFFEKNIFKKKFSYIIIVTLLCFSWNPKAVYHEDVGSIPIYRIITKIIKYY